MAEEAAAQRPAWQTDELEDEWIDEEPASPSGSGHHSSDLSFTQPVPVTIIKKNDLSIRTSSSDDSAGTVLVNEDAPAVQLLPKTPGKNKKVKDFFSPLALEKMFEPPSPPSGSAAPLPLVLSTAPVIPSRLSQMFIPGEVSSDGITEEEDLEEVDEEGEEDSRRTQGTEDGNGTQTPPGLVPPAAKYQFTFAAPQRTPFNRVRTEPNAQSTPLPPARLTPGAPLTDPRLRLFQFQYDTFTRDHLSAMVDSIAVNTPSGDSTPSLGKGSPEDRSSERDRSISRLRSAKRIKLSPASDFSPTGDGAAFIMRPISQAKDYVGESRNLMEKIRQARDFSTVSTTAGGTSPQSRKGAESPVESPAQKSMMRNTSQRLRVSSSKYGDLSKPPPSANGTASSKRSTHSSLAYREQAANLMAQIRNDMKGSKRLFSNETEMSHVVRNEDRSHASSDSRHLPPKDGDEDVTELLLDSLRRPATGSLESPDGSIQSRRILSPRRVIRKISATYDPENELSQCMDQMSLNSSGLLSQFPAPPVDVLVTAPQSVPPPPAVRFDVPNSSPSHLAPPNPGALSYPSSSIRSARNEDLTRFVSSSTTSGTTLTTGSAASFVKHAGPKQMTHIAPSDVPALPDRVGRMVFDKAEMKWVKADHGSILNGPREVGSAGEDVVLNDRSNDSEDPFRDIESIKEDDSGGQELSPDVNTEAVEVAAGVEAKFEVEPLAETDESGSVLTADLEETRIESFGDDSEVEDEEEAELNSFSFDSMDAAAATGSEYANPIDLNDSEEDTEEEDSTVTQSSFTSQEATETVRARAPNEPALPQSPQVTSPPLPTQYSTPLPASRSDPAAPSSGARPVLKSNSVTPISALKDPRRSRFQTPLNRPGHRRSVSFSDGKRDGPILGVGRNAPTPDFLVPSEQTGRAAGSEDEVPDKTHTSTVPSARTKRIADMLHGIENSGFQHDSPSRTSSGRPPQHELQPIKDRKPRSQQAVVGSPDTSREMAGNLPSRSQSVSKMSGRNATFLTECSFGVAHDRLVQVITDVQPFEPYWEQLTSIDLSNRSIESVARLKEFLPRLDSLSLNSNQLSWLSGVPGTVRTLSVASNILTGVTSFNHLSNLESLDISNNNIDSLRQLECLRHLRELRADGNRIDSLDGLSNMDGLVKLSLQHNRLHNVDLTPFRWTRLEMLNLSLNRLRTIQGLGHLPALVALNLDHNLLGELDPNGSMPRLRILRASGNRLQQLNASPFPNLRTLYADNNSLGSIIKANRLTKLENLSLRNQSGRPGLTLTIHDVRDVKRLYLSGNPLKAGFISEPCYNLVYLELAACRLTSLPQDFSKLVPNLRALNLNYNFLEDTKPLEGLTRMKKLTIIGSRVKATKLLVRTLRGMVDIEMLDFRMNPCTLGWYLPLIVKDVPGALQPSDGERHNDHHTASSNPPGSGLSSGRTMDAGTGRNGQRSRNGHAAEFRHETREAGSTTRPPSSSLTPTSTLTANGDDTGTAGSTNSRTPSASVSSTDNNDDNNGSTKSTATNEEWTGDNNGGQDDGESQLSHSGHPGALSGKVSWKDLDSKFRRDLPDDAYVGRLVYRGMVMRACPGIRILDGVETSEKERDKAERILKGIIGINREKKGNYAKETAT